MALLDFQTVVTLAVILKFHFILWVFQQGQKKGWCRGGAHYLGEAHTLRKSGFLQVMSPQHPRSVCHPRHLALLGLSLVSSEPVHHHLPW